MIKNPINSSGTAFSHIIIVINLLLLPRTLIGLIHRENGMKIVTCLKYFLR